MLLSSENAPIVGAVDLVRIAGSTCVPSRPGTEVPPESENRARTHGGPAGTCEALPPPHHETRLVDRVNKDQVPGAQCPESRGSEETGTVR